MLNCYAFIPRKLKALGLFLSKVIYSGEFQLHEKECVIDLVAIMII